MASPQSFSLSNVRDLPAAGVFRVGGAAVAAPHISVGCNTLAKPVACDQEPLTTQQVLRAIASDYRAGTSPTFDAGTMARCACGRAHDGRGESPLWEGP